MDGFTKLARQLMENVLLLIALLKETFAYMLPVELNLTVSLIWDGLVGLNNWVGYAIAAIYYLGTDYDFGLTFCEVMGYLYYVIDGLNYIVAFADIAPEEGESIEDAVGGLAGTLAGGVDAIASGDTDALIDAAGDIAGSVDTDVLVEAGEEIAEAAEGEADAAA